MALSLKLKTTSGKIIETEADPDLTIYDLKAMCYEDLNAAPERQTFVLNGQVCHDDTTLAELNVPESGATFIVLLKKKVVHSNAATQQAPPQSAVEQKMDPLPAAPSLQQANGFPLLNGSMGGMDMGAMQQSLMQNPEMMKQLMDNPMMKQMMSNPELIRNLFSSSPALQKLMEDNPQLRHVLKDPSLMQHAMKAATNPEYYNEMLKNNDRALRNIESIPGGFSALSRLYSQIQKPMERAMDDIYRQRFGKSTTKIADLSDKSKGPTTSAFPNPWNNDPQQPQQQRPQMVQPQMSNLQQMMASMNMMNGNGQGLMNNQLPMSNGFGVPANPSMIYSVQLQELRNMGFLDEQSNCRALVATGGNVAAAVQYLLSQQSNDGNK